MDDLNLSGSYLWLPMLMQLLHIHRSPLLLSNDSDSRFMMSAALQDITHANWAIALCWRRWMIYTCECKSVWVYVCVHTYRASGQNSGCSSLLPCKRNTVMSKEFTSEYGGAPRVISSHSNTPNDHYGNKTRINTIQQTFITVWRKGVII